MPKLTPIAFSVACAFTIIGCASFSQTSPDRNGGPVVQPVLSVQHSPSGEITGAIYRVGRLFQGQGRYPQAISLYREVLEREPNHVEARSSLGVSLAESGRYEEAIAEFEAAIAISPNSAYLHNNLGYALLLKRSNEQAIKELEVARRLDPSPESVASYNLRLAQERIAASANEIITVAPKAPHTESLKLSLAPSPQSAVPSAAPEAQVTSTPRAGLQLIQVAPSVYELRSAAKRQPGEEATRTQETVPAPKVAPLLKPFKLEVSNGNGITGLAKRVAGRLAEQGVTGARLTNQRPFEQQGTEIQYRHGYAAEAAALADKLQRKVQLMPSKHLAAHIHVRLVLGRDVPSESALVLPQPSDRTIAARLAN